MTTCASLADRAQIALSDTGAAVWPQAAVEDWVADAVREYSQAFPRTSSQLILTTAGVHAYTLSVDFQGVLLVEYPAGQDPPRYLQRLSHANPRFWLSDGYYDVEPSGVGSDGGALYLSASPAEGQTITLTYHSNVDIPASPADILAVPGEHEHLLILFVVWKAHAERLAKEAQSPSVEIRNIQQMKLAAQAAEQSYRAALATAKTARGVAGVTGPWKMDNHDRIY